MLLKRIILFCVLTAAITLFVGCTNDEELSSGSTGESKLVVTDDGRAVFDGKIYEKYTVIE